MAEPHERLNALEPEAAAAALRRCCGAERWVQALLAARPFVSTAALQERALSIWNGLAAQDYLEAFSHHPQIGENLDELRRRFAATHTLSEREQSGVSNADEGTLLALREGNRAYRERFGHIFIVCATGKSADEMLALLRERLTNDPADEIRLAAGEQAKITALRLTAPT